MPEPDGCSPLKILWLSPYFPWPATRGASIRLRNQVVEIVGQGHRVDLWVVGDPAAATSEVELATMFFPPRARTSAWDKLASVVRGWPRDSWYAASPELLQRLRELEPGRFDVIVVTQAFMASAVTVLKRQRIPIVLDAHNVEADVLRQLVHAESGLARCKRFADFIAMRRRERRTFHAVDMIFTTSQEDKARIRGIAPGTPIELHPNTVDLRQIPFRRTEMAKNPTLLLTGTFAYSPNEEAAVWLCNEVLPRVREVAPEARVRLVGSQPSARVRRLAGEHVHVVGEVPTMQEELERATVAVVPVRAGGGTRLKALEAMAAGVPVVGTTLGLEGLHVENEVHALVADTPDAFADAIIKIVRCGELGRGLSERARQLVIDRFDSRLDAVALVSDLRNVARMGRRC